MSMTLTDLSSLPPIVEQRGGDPELVRAELLDIIGWGMRNHPRSKQKRLGPSEIGDPCARRLAYKLAGTATVNAETSWRPTVGTAVHTWLEETFGNANGKLGGVRFLVETKVDVGEVAGIPVLGRVDVYDRVTATSIDWKVVGPTSLKWARLNGPSQQYRVQAQLYGRGWARRGLPIDRVAVCWLPSNGELREAVYWSEPYDETVALAALDRVAGIQTLVGAAGPLAPGLLPTTEAFCTRCDWYLPAATNPTEACPGHRPAATPTALAG